ncbi:MAG: hypothetical protein ACKOU7_06610 [Ferruginibacter sp.]
MKTKNKISAILLVMALSLASVSNAQSPMAPVKKGSVTFSAGVGLGNEYSSDYYNAAFGSKAVIEAGLWNAGPGVISLGGEIGSSFSNGGIYSNYKTSTIVVAGRSAWHYGWKVKGLDTYAGLSAGAGFHNYRYDKNGYVKETEVIPVFAGFAGASYFVTPDFGFNVEVGNDITRLQGGIVFKLR